VAVINQPSKIPFIPCINEELSQKGYSSSFLYGGDLAFGNIKGYLMNKKFDEVLDETQFTQYPKGHLGVHDGYMFKEFLSHINQTQEPFLSCLFTLSSHMPYDYPPSDHWQAPKNDPEKQYTEGIHYTDIQIGLFFNEAKKQAWYNNTLFVLVADHSHNTLQQWNAASSMRAHIPLLLVGGALKETWRGKSWDKVVSQLDIASSLLHQMQLPTQRYKWSRDLFNPQTSSSAFYVFFGGAGYVNDAGYAASNQMDLHTIQTNLSDSARFGPMQQKAMSFQQLLYEEVEHLGK
jgi:phosphoglycerol transferase MdoB-like AlkP superfamily enzyme